MSDDRSDIEKQLEEISEATGEFLYKGYYASTWRRNGDIVRLAKAHRLLMPFIKGTFFRMVRCLSLLDPRQLKESAISLIPFLEDEEHARSFQQDFSEGYYEFTRGWMTACVYENLADATGEVDGYNSDGMHQCISDGLQVCRRTGKLECISCFREYAADVYLASDDFTMARHQCETVINNPGSWSDRGDMRSELYRKLAWISLVEGRLAQAIENAEKAVELSMAEGVNVKFSSRAEALTCLDEARILAGQDRIDWSNPDPGGLIESLPPEDEWPELTLQIERNNALLHCLNGEYDQAIEILRKWDQTLDRNSCLAKWFEIRLRLIAAMHLSGQQNRVERLAEQLRTRATAANDYLTIRRLDLLLNEETVVTPICCVGPIDIGPCAAELPAADTPPPTELPAESNAEQQGDAEDDSNKPLDPVMERFNSLLQRFFSAEDDDDAGRDAVVTEYLSITGDLLSDPKLTAPLLHFGEPLNGEGQRAAEFWEWAQTFENAFPDVAGVVCRVASFANTLRYSGGEATFELIDGELIEQKFRRALSLDRDSISAHWLAGEHFLIQQEYGEAERCLARACRLERAFAQPALLLAELYTRTDRPRDALAALDMCLREGCDDPNVAWEALVKAISANQYDSALTYADRFDELKPGEPWINYYRAIAQVESNRADDALRSIELEAQREELPGTYHLEVLKTCALMILGRNAEAGVAFGNVLETRISTVDFMTQVGINNLLNMLWRHTATLDDTHPQRQQLQDLLLATCSMPDEFFDQRRTANGEQQGGEQSVNFYQVLIEQSLPSNWSESVGCYSGQGHWKNYRIVWGVLGIDEDQASQFALEGQRLCAAEPAEVVKLVPGEDTFKDIPGIVWIGDRWNEPENDVENEE